MPSCPDPPKAPFFFFVFGSFFGGEGAGFAARCFCFGFRGFQCKFCWFQIRWFLAGFCTKRFAWSELEHPVDGFLGAFRRSRAEP